MMWTGVITAQASHTFLPPSRSTVVDSDIVHGAGPGTDAATGAGIQTLERLG